MNPIIPCRRGHLQDKSFLPIHFQSEIIIQNEIPLLIGEIQFQGC